MILMPNIQTKIPIIIQVNWLGSKYIGIDLDWNYKRRYIKMLMIDGVSLRTSIATTTNIGHVTCKKCSQLNHSNSKQEQNRNKIQHNNSNSCYNQLLLLQHPVRTSYNNKLTS